MRAHRSCTRSLVRATEAGKHLQWLRRGPRRHCALADTEDLTSSIIGGLVLRMRHYRNDVVEAPQ